MTVDLTSAVGRLGCAMTVQYNISYMTIIASYLQSRRREDILSVRTVHSDPSGSRGLWLQSGVHPGIELFYKDNIHC